MSAHKAALSGSTDQGAVRINCRSPECAIEDVEFRGILFLFVATCSASLKGLQNRTNAQYGIGYAQLNLSSICLQ